MAAELIGICFLLAIITSFFFEGETGAQNQNHYNPELLEIVWDAPVTNEDGSPLTDLDHYDIAVSKYSDSPDTSSHPVEFKSVSCNEATCSMKLWDHFSTLMADAQMIYVQVRAVDKALNASDWSEQLAIPLDTMPPGIPKNLRVRVIIEIGGTTP